jgi:hypothetical protein
MRSLAQVGRLNLAGLFASIDSERSVLLLDKVDSFLGHRRQAQRSWESKLALGFF